MAGLITDYGDLQTAVADWLYRSGDTDFEDNAPLFINQFEQKFKRTMRLFEMQQVDTITVSSAQIALPPGFLEAIRLTLSGISSTPDQVLGYVTPDFSARLDATTITSGIPHSYTIIDGSIIISPQKWVPTNITATMAFYTFTQLKDADGGTNWLLANHDDLYLYGALMQGAAFIDDKETVAFWKAGRDEALAELLEADKKKRFAGPLTVQPSMTFRSARSRHR